MENVENKKLVFKCQKCGSDTYELFSGEFACEKEDCDGVYTLSEQEKSIYVGAFDTRIKSERL